MGESTSFYIVPTWNNETSVPKSVQDFIDICESSYGTKCFMLTYYFEHCSKEEIQFLIASVFPTMWNGLSKSVTLFPSGTLTRLPAGASGEVKFTREQIFCLLVHMLMGHTLDQGMVMFYANFRPWIQHAGQMEILPDTPRLAYLHSLFHYFKVFTTQILPYPERRNEQVSFCRFCQPNISETLKDDLATGILFDHSFFEICMNGHIGDSRVGTETEVDFANKNIGFGATGTQEEILFGMSPEMCVARLIYETLKDNECAIIQGALRICRPEGYGTRVVAIPLSLEEIFSDLAIQRCVLCMDASDFSDYTFEIRKGKFIEYSNDDNLKFQLTEKNLSREMCKLLVSLSACPGDVPIASGKWGAGAFMGNPVLKGILQAVGACLSRKLVRMYVSHDLILAEKLETILQQFQGREVLKIWELLLSSEAQNVFLLRTEEDR